MLFPVDSVPEGPRLETNKALLLIDFQNDFVASDGKLYVANTSEFLNKLPQLVSSFRSKGDVIWIRTEYTRSRMTISPITGSYSILLEHFLEEYAGAESRRVPDYSDAEQADYQQHYEPHQARFDTPFDVEAFLAPDFHGQRQQSCLPNTTGAEHTDILAQSIDYKKDLNIVKNEYSAFADTPLLMQLRTRLITHLYICGSLCNVSVYATVLDAVRHGLEVTLIEDCLGYRSERCHVEAMRQMADSMGANGIDYQELRDDLAGLLGDVIYVEDFPKTFQVSLPAPNSKSQRTRPDSQPLQARPPSDHPSPNLSRNPNEQDIKYSNFLDTGAISSTESVNRSESSRGSARKATPEPSPPRKRSNSDLDELEEDRTPKILNHLSRPRTSCHSAQGEMNVDSATQRPHRLRDRKTRNYRESSTMAHTQTTVTSHGASRSVGDLPDSTNTISESDSDQAVVASTAPHQKNMRSQIKRKFKKTSAEVLGPDSKIGEGDCGLFVDIMSTLDAGNAFDNLKSSIKWQKMFHRSGEVPRLVAVQGTVSQNGNTIPIYRHPADESPELLPFDSNVEALRRVAEELVGHELNHVLIQWYRNGEDNISEHSDKTLDIVRGSNIVNISLGAQRTMTIRTKKPPITVGPTSATAVPSGPPRLTQKIPLPHNSLFLLGQTTNQSWLHSIRADKRPASEKTSAELAFGGERISLTFRQIGTFIDVATQTIWGQGATAKTQAEARKLVDGTDLQPDAEAMIRAFGQENHRGAADWIWDDWYGGGFDVVNFATRIDLDRSEL